MTNNVSAIMDDSYNYSMWVELYNTSNNTSYNQYSFYLTDNLKQPKKWAPPSKLISPGGFSILWFERPSKTGHSTFRLDPEGGKLFLLNAALQVIDSVSYPQQYRNISYGRKTDGGNEWVFFEQYSNGASNNGKLYAKNRCPQPVFNIPGGFYSSVANISFGTPASTDTIFYTTNGSEPTRKSTKYNPGSSIALNYTRVIRAKTFSAGKLSSDIATATYFLNARDFNLPVVSIVTEPANLYDNTIGIYVQGTNGIVGNGMSTPANWNQDWDRPANFELFDTILVSKVNQELDISIAGGWSRKNKQKSMKINPTKKYYKNSLDYDFFKATKPGMKYRSILYRNGGNDFDYAMLRDGFMQSLVMKRMNLDYCAYEPAVCFMNGEYYGIQNLRERSDVDFVYSNYGLDESEIKLLESYEMSYDTSFTKISNYISANDISKTDVYNKICGMIDIENFTDYFISEIYFGNTDWPDNNIKVWKKLQGGKWRWILFDTDFGYNLYDLGLYNHNTLIYALGELTSDIPPAWSTLMLKRLVLNETFRKQLIDRFAIQISSTFDYNRSVRILDSLATKIKTEIVYHKNKWGSVRDFNYDLSNMKTFAANRPAKMLGFISSRFLNNVPVKTINISSNIAGTGYTFNNQLIRDNSISLKYFANQTINLKANAIPGYKFKQWELNGNNTINTAIANGSNWKYFDGSSIPASNWFVTQYSDNNWKTGNAQFGYGSKGEVTTIDYGPNANEKYTTTYFRKSFNINNLSNKSNFTVTAFVDDGIVVYVNGTEIGRGNMPAGVIGFSTVATTYNNGETFSFQIPQNLLREGDNLIAAEVHQNIVTSSDMIFNLQLTFTESATGQIVNDPEFKTTLSSDFGIKAIYEAGEVVPPAEKPLIYINEVVLSNNIYQDEYTDTDDYIEIYNDEQKEVNLAGWYISDTPVNPTLHQISSAAPAKTTIPGKGRLILWADDQTAQGANHLKFKLSKEGETITMSKPNDKGIAELIDSVQVPALDQNMSYSRVPDGGKNWYRKNPTFNATNGYIDATEDVLTNNIKLYPTLVNQWLTIENAAGKEIVITDLSGKIILRHNCLSDSEQISASTLPKGMYIIKMGNCVFKIIKL